MMTLNTKRSRRDYFLAMVDDYKKNPSKYNTKSYKLSISNEHPQYLVESQKEFNKLVVDGINPEYIRYSHPLSKVFRDIHKLKRFTDKMQVAHNEGLTESYFKNLVRELANDNSRSQPIDSSNEYLSSLLGRKWFFLMMKSRGLVLWMNSLGDQIYPYLVLSTRSLFIQNITNSTEHHGVSNALSTLELLGVIRRCSSIVQFDSGSNNRATRFVVDRSRLIQVSKIYKSNPKLKWYLESNKLNNDTHEDIIVDQQQKIMTELIESVSGSNTVDPLGIGRYDRVISGGKSLSTKSLLKAIYDYYPYAEKVFNDFMETNKLEKKLGLHSTTYQPHQHFKSDGVTTKSIGIRAYTTGLGSAPSYKNNPKYGRTDETCPISECREGMLLNEYYPDSDVTYNEYKDKYYEYDVRGSALAITAFLNKDEWYGSRSINKFWIKDDHNWQGGRFINNDLYKNICSPNSEYSEDQRSLDKSKILSMCMSQDLNSWIRSAKYTHSLSESEAVELWKSMDNYIGKSYHSEIFWHESNIYNMVKLMLLRMGVHVHLIFDGFIIDKSDAEKYHIDDVVMDRIILEMCYQYKTKYLGLKSDYNSLLDSFSKSHNVGLSECRYFTGYYDDFEYYKECYVGDPKGHKLYGILDKNY